MKKRAGLLSLFFVLTTLSALLITCTALSVTDFLQLIFPSEEGSFAGTQSATMSNPVMMAVGKVYEALARLEPMKALTLYAVLLFLLYGFKNLFSYLSIVIFSKIRIGVVSDIRERLHAAVMQQSLSQWSSQQQGQWLSRMTNDIAEYEDNVLDSIRMLITAVTSMLIYVFMLLYLDWRLTLMVVAVMGVGALLLSSSRRLKRQGRKLQEIGGELTTTTQETLDSLKEIKAATAIDYVNRRQREQNERFTRMRIKLYRKLFAASPLSDFLGNTIVVAILIIGATRVLGVESSMPAAMFVSYIIIYVLMLAPIKDFSNAIAQMKKGRGVEERFNEITASRGEKTVAKMQNTLDTLEIRDVCFSYDGQPVIDHLTMTVPMHAHTAIIGESGSGKTTFGRLVTGLLEQQSGDILINGNPSRAEERRGRIAYIPQEPMLFNDTVEGNIRFGREWLNPDDLTKAARLAQVEPILHTLPQGMKSAIGDGGGRLSGGERQRISIARAIAGNPDVLVMDEATAALDAATEQNISHQIRETLAGRTVIVIAHRPSTIAACDNVFDISRKKWVRFGLMICGLLFGGVSQASEMGDTIPLQGQQTGGRTVELMWSAGEGTTTVFRQYPGESQPTMIATTEGSSWTDHHNRCVCGDTVRYSISRGTDEGYAAVMVSDNEPTAMAEWGVVTVEDENVRLRWRASIDTDIMGYLVCEGNPSVVIDTVFGHDNNNYTYNEGDVTTVYHFRLCAFDSCRQASPLTDVCNNIVLTLDADPCSRQVRAAWNGYENLPSGVAGYELWASEDGSAFRRAVQNDEGSTQASIEVSESCMSLTAYVKAVSVDGQTEAFSNRVSIQFSTVERPAYFYLRKVSVTDDGKSVDIVAQTDPTFTATDYRLYRTVGGRPASVVAHLSPDNDGTLVWRDKDVEPKTEPCGYYLGVDDGCGRNEMRTATGYTLLPELTTQGEGLELRWDAYGGWTGSTQYQVVSSPLDVDAWEVEGNTWESVYTLASNGGIRRYKVVAFEGSNSEYQRDDSLQSVVVYHRPRTDIWLPNAFTPTETSNNTFFPTAQYINPQGYSFMIFNRQGMMIYSTTETDGYWDGRYKGVLQPNGVYVYKITYRQNDGTDQYITGTVMLIR